MNLLQTIEAQRPNVGKMPVVARNQVRERLFDVAIRGQSGPTRVAVNPTNSTRANALRLGALVLLGVVGVGGLAYSATRDVDDNRPTSQTATTLGTTGTSEPVRSRAIEAPVPTIAPTTTAAPIAGTEQTPLLLPRERSRLDELIVVRKQLGGSSLLLRTPELATVALREADGITRQDPEPEDPTDDDADPVVAPRVFGAIEVTLQEDPGVYDVRIPCGTLEVREGQGFLPFRPQLIELFESMSLDEGSIRISLPAGWTVIGSGASTDEFILGIPVDVNGRNVTITLAQYPNGSLAVAGFGDKQYGPTTFRGQEAWISRNLDVPGEFELIGMNGSTAFKVSATDIALAELDQVMASFLAGDIDDWVNRFGSLPVTEDPDIRTCGDQPEFDLLQP